MTDPLASRPAPGTPRRFEFPQSAVRTLDSGVRVIVASLPRLPLVSLTVLIRSAGAATDEPDLDGVAQLTASMLLEGTTRLDGATLAERFEDLGTTLTTAADWDATMLSSTVQPDRVAGTIALMSDVLRNPSLPQRECDRLQAERRADRLQLIAEPRALADAAFSWLCYGAGSRFRRPIGGTAASVAALGRDDLVRWWTSRYDPAWTTCVFAGDVTIEQAETHARSLTEGWNCQRGVARDLNDGARHRGVAVHMVAKPDAAQCELRIGHVGVSRLHPDYFPLTVMNAILGGLFSSRINLNLRERHGYTYGAHSGFDWRRGAGPFTIDAAVNTPVAGAAVREVLAEIDGIRSTVVSSDELSLATSYLSGVFPLRFETTAAVASALAVQEMFGLPDDYFDTYRARISAVTAVDVLRAAQTHLHPDRLQIVALGNPEALEPQLDGLGLGVVHVHSAEDAEAAR